MDELQSSLHVENAGISFILKSPLATDKKCVPSGKCRLFLTKFKVFLEMGRLTYFIW